MKERIAVLTFSFIFLAGSVSFAQLIDYSKRSGAQVENTQTEVQPTQNQKKTSNRYRKASNTTQAVSKLNRVEKRYDLNNDGELQKAEEKKFLEDIYSVVSKKGSISISSNVLTQYDKNRDGKISKKELRPIQQRIR